MNRILTDVAWEPEPVSSLPTIITVLGIVLVVAAVAVTLCVVLVKNSKAKRK